jgi:hypothetical protein
MPNPKSGKTGAIVSPVEPEQAQAADQADPGEVEEVKAQQRQAQSGKYGSAQTKPHKPGPEKTSWIEIEMLDEDDRPVPGEAYRIKLPDDTTTDGTLDEKGFARAEGIEPGTCQITFPKLDQEAWEKL